MDYNKLKTKTPNEIANWIEGHKTINKRVRAIWKRFILFYLKNDSYNLHEIFDLINNNNLGETLTSEMLIDMEFFFSK
jgi:hypothetical protein